ncbi:MAG: RNA polymerase sigma factor [Deltaproteobacteria bacterium]|nr:RNA polymerase sigma factor [Deltaproteobacteria bacterium]
MQGDSFIPGDSEIVRQVLDGDVDAFAILLARHKELIVSIVIKHTPARYVEEIAHDVFVRAYQALPTFKGKSTFKQWLVGIAVKTCYDFWRKKYRTRDFPMSSLSEKQQERVELIVAAESDRLCAENDSRKAAVELLDWALAKLSAEDRMVLEMVYLEGLSVKEAAGLLGWSVAKVKVRSFRSRRKLRTLLTGLIDVERRDL